MKSGPKIDPATGVRYWKENIGQFAKKEWSRVSKEKWKRGMIRDQKKIWASRNMTVGWRAFVDS